MDQERATLYCEGYGGGGSVVNTIVASPSPVSYISPTVRKNKPQCYRPLREMADFQFPVRWKTLIWNCLHTANRNMTESPSARNKNRMRVFRLSQGCNWNLRRCNIAGWMGGWCLTFRKSVVVSSSMADVVHRPLKMRISRSVEYQSLGDAATYLRKTNIETAMNEGRSFAG